VTFVASHVAPTGGMERAVYEIAERMAGRGWHVTVIARACAVTPGPNVAFHRIRSPSRPATLALPLSYVLGSRLVKRHARGAIHTVNPVIWQRAEVHQAQFCLAAYRANVGIPRRRRSWITHRINEFLATRFGLAVERRALRSSGAHLVAPASRGLQREIEQFYPRPSETMTVVTNGVDPDRFRPDADARARNRAALGIADDAPVAVFVGGDWGRKNLATAIEAVGEAPGWHLLVVGRGDQPSYERLAGEHGAGDRVHFVGHVPDPEAWLAAGDALLAPSSYEAFSLAMLEGASAGLVLLTAPINGAEDLVEPDVNGWLLPIEPAAFGARLRELSGDRSRLREMGAAARRTALTYSWDRIADQFEALYRASGAADRADAGR
jgi:glycosyltransferase involved in cell wall biosynthesis